MVVLEVNGAPFFEKLKDHTLKKKKKKREGRERE
jgi:hypothetical protein